MQTFEGIAAAASAVRAHFYRNEDTLFPLLREKLEPAVMQGESPVRLIDTFSQVVYSNPDLASNDDKVLAASCLELIEREGYHGRLDDKAAAMSLALRRDAGEKAPTGISWPEKANDPAPNPVLVVPAEPEEVEEGQAAPAT